MDRANLERAPAPSRGTAIDRRELRLEVCRRALSLAEHPNVNITTNMYAYKSDITRTLQVCILGGLIHEALAADLLGDVPLGATTFSVMAFRCDFYRKDNPEFVLDVLSALWEVEDAALIECAFEGRVSVLLGRRIRILESSKASTTLYDFLNCDMKKDDLESQRDRSLVGQFDYARTLRASVPDDTERYRRILQNVVDHGGLYNPRGG